MSSVSMCSPATYLSRPHTLGSTRSFTWRTTSPKATRVQPALDAASGITRLLLDEVSHHVDECIHCEPELPATGIIGGPRRLEVVPVSRVHRVPDLSNV